MKIYKETLVENEGTIKCNQPVQSSLLYIFPRNQIHDSTELQFLHDGPSQPSMTTQPGTSPANVKYLCQSFPQHYKNLVASKPYFLLDQLAIILFFWRQYTRACLWKVVEVAA